MNANRRWNTALIAEPDQSVRLTLSSVLRNEGWRVLATDCAAAAYECSDTLRPDLAMVDLEPAAAAEALCVGLRIRYGPELPIVGLGHRDAVAEPQWLANPPNMADTLTVPFELRRLQTLLDRAQRIRERNASLRILSEDAIQSLHAARRVYTMPDDSGARQP